MVDWNALDLFLVTRGLTAVALVVLAAWVLWLNPRDALHRSLSLFAFLVAMERGLYLLSPNTPAQSEDYAIRVSVYFLLAIPFAALWLGMLYLRRYHPSGSLVRRVARHPAAGVLILLGAAAVLGTYALDRSLYTQGGGELGPLEVFASLPYLAYGGLALLFARGAVQTDTAVCARALTLASIGFVLPAIANPVFQVTVTALTALGFSPGPSLTDPVSQAQTAIEFLALVAAGGALWVLHQVPIDTNARRPIGEWRRRGTTAGVLAFTLGVVFAVLFMTWTAQRLSLAFAYAFVVGIWFLALPALTAFAILRHDLFDIDVRVKTGLRRSLIVGALVAVFFSASEAAEKVVEAAVGSTGASDAIATAAGLLTAGTLLIALRPLQRMAERLANAAMPHAQYIADMSRKQRLDLFREQAQLAWLDGELRTKERLLLDRLRDRLDIDPTTATRIEEDALTLFRRGGAPSASSA